MLRNSKIAASNSLIQQFGRVVKTLDLKHLVASWILSSIPSVTSFTFHSSGVDR